MNVLVYNGPEVVHSSLTAVLTSLRSLLLPHYVVQPIEHIALAKQPWAASCALLVFPRLSQPFQAPTHVQIQDYVERGGAFLAFGAGANCSTRSIVTGMENLSLGTGISSANPTATSLRFFDKFNNAYIHPSFESPHDARPRLAKVRSLDGDIAQALYQVSRAEFTGFKGERGVKILGRYIGDGEEGEIAGLGSDIGGGRIALWSPSLEQSLTEEPASVLISQENNLIELDKERNDLLKRTIIYLGLHLPATPDSDSGAEARPIARPFPQFLVAFPDRPDIVSRIIGELSESFERNDPSVPEAPKILKDANDTFHFHESTTPNTDSLLIDCKASLPVPSDPSTWQPKHIIVHRNGSLPSKDYTNPHFDVEVFFKHLRSLYPITQETNKWPIGSTLLFSPAVTSTQTLLDKNPIYLSSLLTPTVSLASHQLLARGRGSNAWLSPTGSLSTSIHLRLTSDDGVPWNKLVFVQYLYALAVCEGVRDDSVLGFGGDESGEGEGWRVRIKWPNDIYALVGPKGAEEKKKIAGILVSTSFGAGGVDIIIGCGLNVFNEQPMTSLSQLLRNTPSGNKRRSNLSLERTAAVILAKFEKIWNQFVAAKGNFEPFMDLYLKRWMHSDQLVTLTTTTIPTPVRITGITLDHGLLRTVPERKGLTNPYFSSSSGREGQEEYIDLQPDGNSFDLMAGMIKAKQ